MTRHSEFLYISPSHGELDIGEYVDCIVRIKDTSNDWGMFDVNNSNSDAQQNKIQSNLRGISCKVSCLSTEHGIQNDLEIVYSALEQNKILKSSHTNKTESAKSGVTALRSATSLNNCPQNCERITILQKSLLDFKFARKNESKTEVFVRNYK